MARLQSKTIVIFGGATSLGLEMAKRFISEGAEVVISDKATIKGKEIVESVGATFLPLVPGKRCSYETIVKDVLDLYGCIDGVVNLGMGTSTQTAKTEEQEESLQAACLGTMAAVKAMQKNGSKGGSILNAFNEPSEITTMTAELKSAYVKLTTDCAQQNMFNNIRVNLVCPSSGYHINRHLACSSSVSSESLDAEGIPLSQKAAHIEDIVAAAVFLLSDESRFISGTSIPVTGSYRSN
eukprot:Colp12_sorted_trinity150504_noHs@2961